MRDIRKIFLISYCKLLSEGLKHIQCFFLCGIYVIGRFSQYRCTGDWIVRESRGARITVRCLKFVLLGMMHRLDGLHDFFSQTPLIRGGLGGLLGGV